MHIVPTGWDSEDFNVPELQLLEEIITKDKVWSLTFLKVKVFSFFFRKKQQFSKLSYFYLHPCISFSDSFRCLKSFVIHVSNISHRSVISESVGLSSMYEY